MNRRLRYIFVSLLCMMVSSCVHETDLSNLKSMSFSSDIQPILAGNCTQSGCHAATGGEFPLVTYDDVMSNGDIEPGNAHKSKLYEVVSGKEGDEPMPPPPRPALSTEQLQFIYLWIEQGAKNN